MSCTSETIEGSKLALELHGGLHLPVLGVVKQLGIPEPGRPRLPASHASHAMRSKVLNLPESQSQGLDPLGWGIWGRQTRSERRL